MYADRSRAWEQKRGQAQNTIYQSTTQQRVLNLEREKSCPFLIRVFWKVGEHHDPSVYQKWGVVPPAEVSLYTWLDATLREVGDLVQQGIPTDSTSNDSDLSFQLVYPNSSGQFIMKPVGSVSCNPTTQRPSDHQTLHDLKFQIGDFIDVAVVPSKSQQPNWNRRFGGGGGGGGGGYQ